MQTMKKLPQGIAAIGIGLAVLGFITAVFYAFLSLAQF